MFVMQTGAKRKEMKILPLIADVGCNQFLDRFGDVVMLSGGLQSSDFVIRHSYAITCKYISTRLFFKLGVYIILHWGSRVYE